MTLKKPIYFQAVRLGLSEATLGEKLEILGDCMFRKNPLLVKERGNKFSIYGFLEKFDSQDYYFKTNEETTQRRPVKDLVEIVSL